MRVLLLGSLLLVTPLVAQNPPARSGFPATLNGGHVNTGSIALGDLTGDGLPEIVVGGLDGVVHAYRANGTELWSVDKGLIPFDGKAAIGDVDGDGFPEVVIGAGSTFSPVQSGILFVLNHLGAEQCRHENAGVIEGVFSSPAIADLDHNDGGLLEIAYGSWDHIIRVLHHDCTVLWQRDARDTVFSSPAIGDLDGDGDLDVIIGADMHAEGPPHNTTDGGRLFAMDGATGADLPGFPKHLNEVITSSPALGDLDGDGRLDIVVGTGNCWGSGDVGCGNPQHPGVGEFINAWNRLGANLPGWPRSIPGRVANGSPALADLDGDGSLEVVINAAERFSGGASPDDGWVYALDGNGTNLPGWPRQPAVPSDCNGNSVPFATTASPIVADLVPGGGLEVALPSNWEIVVWDSSGNQLSRAAFQPPACTLPGNPLVLATGGPLHGTPGVGDLDGNGTLEIVAAGYRDINGLGDVGGLFAWNFSQLGAEKPWPVFRGRQDNRASPLPFFEDGFESGDTDAWSSTVP